MNIEFLKEITNLLNLAKDNTSVSIILIAVLSFSEVYLIYRVVTVVSRKSSGGNDEIISKSVEYFQKPFLLLADKVEATTKLQVELIEKLTESIAALLEIVKVNSEEMKSEITHIKKQNESNYATIIKKIENLQKTQSNIRQKLEKNENFNEKENKKIWEQLARHTDEIIKITEGLKGIIESNNLFSLKNEEGNKQKSLTTIQNETDGKTVPKDEVEK